VEIGYFKGISGLRILVHRDVKKEKGGETFIPPPCSMKQPTIL
jgi:hypothetical protein